MENEPSSSEDCSSDRGRFPSRNRHVRDPGGSTSRNFDPYFDEEENTIKDFLHVFDEGHKFEANILCAQKVRKQSGIMSEVEKVLKYAGSRDKQLQLLRQQSEEPHEGKVLSDIRAELSQGSPRHVIYDDLYSMGFLTVLDERFRDETPYAVTAKNLIEELQRSRAMKVIFSECHGSDYEVSGLSSDYLERKCPELFPPAFGVQLSYKFDQEDCEWRLRVFHHIANFKHLVKLNIGRSIRYIEELRVICHGLVYNSALENLDLSNNFVVGTDEGCTIVAHMLLQRARRKCAPTLEVLTLNHVKMGPSSVKRLAEALTHADSNLQGLSLKVNPIGDSGAIFLGQILRDKNCSLVALDLTFTGLGAKAIEHLTEGLSNNPYSRLMKLEVSANNFGDAGVGQLAELLQKHSNLKRLGCHGVGMGPTGLRRLTMDLASNTSLMRLETGTDMGDEGLLYLSKLLELNASLKVLHFDSSSTMRIGECIVFAEAVKNNTTLEELGFNDRSLGGIDGVIYFLQHLSGAPRGYYSFYPSGGWHSDSLKGSNLKSIRLSCADEGEPMIGLGDALGTFSKSHPSLTSLALKGVRLKPSEWKSMLYSISPSHLLLEQCMGLDDDTSLDGFWLFVLRFQKDEKLQKLIIVDSPMRRADLLTMVFQDKVLVVDNGMEDAIPITEVFAGVAAGLQSEMDEPTHDEFSNETSNNVPCTEVTEACAKMSIHVHTDANENCGPCSPFPDNVDLKRVQYSDIFLPNSEGKSLKIGHTVNCEHADGTGFTKRIRISGEALRNLHGPWTIGFNNILARDAEDNCKSTESSKIVEDDTICRDGPKILQAQLIPKISFEAHDSREEEMNISSCESSGGSIILYHNDTVKDEGLGPDDIDGGSTLRLHGDKYETLDLAGKGDDEIELSSEGGIQATTKNPSSFEPCFTVEELNALFPASIPVRIWDVLKGVFGDLLSACDEETLDYLCTVVQWLNSFENIPESLSQKPLICELVKAIEAIKEKQSQEFENLYHKLKKHRMMIKLKERFYQERRGRYQNPLANEDEGRSDFQNFLRLFDEMFEADFIFSIKLGSLLNSFQNNIGGFGCEPQVIGEMGGKGWCENNSPNVMPHATLLSNFKDELDEIGTIHDDIQQAKLEIESFIQMALDPIPDMMCIQQCNHMIDGIDVNHAYDIPNLDLSDQVIELWKIIMNNMYSNYNLEKCFEDLKELEDIVRNLNKPYGCTHSDGKIDLQKHGKNQVQNDLFMNVFGLEEKSQNYNIETLLEKGSTIIYFYAMKGIEAEKKFSWHEAVQEFECIKVELKFGEKNTFFSSNPQEYDSFVSWINEKLWKLYEFKLKNFAKAQEIHEEMFGLQKNWNYMKRMACRSILTFYNFLCISSNFDNNEAMKELTIQLFKCWKPCDDVMAKFAICSTLSCIYEEFMMVEDALFWIQEANHELKERPVDTCCYMSSTFTREASFLRAIGESQRAIHALEEYDNWSKLGDLEPKDARNHLHLVISKLQIHSLLYLCSKDTMYNEENSESAQKSKQGVQKNLDLLKKWCSYSTSGRLWILFNDLERRWLNNMHITKDNIEDISWSLLQVKMVPLLKMFHTLTKYLQFAYPGLCVFGLFKIAYHCKAIMTEMCFIANQAPIDLDIFPITPEFLAITWKCYDQIVQHEMTTRREKILALIDFTNMMDMLLERPIGYISSLYMDLIETLVLQPLEQTHEGHVVARHKSIQDSCHKLTQILQNYAKEGIMRCVQLLYDTSLKQTDNWIAVLEVCKRNYVIIQGSLFMQYIAADLDIVNHAVGPQCSSYNNSPNFKIPKEALLWAERGRTCALLKQLGGASNGLNITQKSYQELQIFDTDDVAAWSVLKASQSACGPGTLIVEYATNCYYTDSNAPYNIYIMREDRVDWSTTKELGDMEKRLQRLHSDAKNQPQREEIEIVEDLEYIYNVIISPFESILQTMKPQQKVVFCPTELLTFVPFAALRNPKKPRLEGYLIQNHTISITPSLRVLSKCKERWDYLKSLPLMSGPGAIVAIGDPDYDEENWKRLPETRNEVEALDCRFPGYVEKFLGSKATPTNVLCSADKASKLGCSQAIVHIGAHGIVNQDCPKGALVLSESSEMSHAITQRPKMNECENARIEGTACKDMENMNLGCLLRSEDIYESSIDWRAQLVVLSACETMKGLVTAEGVHSLPRAFMVGGVPSTVVSLWPLKDSAYPATHLYSNLWEGMDVAVALRETMLSMINDPQTMFHVSEWAALAVWGLPTVRLPLELINPISKVEILTATRKTNTLPDWLISQLRNT